MTVQSLPWAIQGQSHSAEIGRNLTAAMFGAPVASFTNSVAATTAGGSHGVVGSGDLAVTQNGTPNMSVNVAAGRALVRSGNASSIAAGTYAVMNDATYNVSISAADPTNPRIDLVIIQVRDTNYGEAADGTRITVVTGTPAASPAVPSLASYPNSLVLAQVAVGAAVTTITNANITNKRTRAFALGGVAVCTSTTRPSGVSLYEGLVIYEADTNYLLVYNGTAWAMVAGAGTYTPTLTNIAVGTGGAATNTASWWFHGGADGGTLTLLWSAALGTSGASVSGVPNVTLPSGFSLSSVIGGTGPLGTARHQQSTTRYFGPVAYSSSSSVNVYVYGASATYVSLASPSATVPFTWAAGDAIVFEAVLPGTFTF